MSTAYSHATQAHSGKEVREQFYTRPMLADDLLTLVHNIDGKKLDKVTERLANTLEIEAKGSRTLGKAAAGCSGI